MKVDRHTHTLEEIQELEAWFKGHMNELPDALQIDASTFTPDLKETVGMLFEQAYITCGNSKMQGCVWLLKKIRDKVEGGGGVSSGE